MKNYSFVTEKLIDLNANQKNPYVGQDQIGANLLSIR
jgi:hypothetical protein